MKKYRKNGTIEKFICNCCGHEVVCDHGILQEEFFQARASWGYFSERDGEDEEWDLCQTCYEKLIQSFKIKPDVKERTELVLERG